jgi:dihydropyrimidinase
MPRTVIQGGIVITATSSFRADVLIDGETIIGLMTDATLIPGDEVIDASGCYVLPGLIDAHTHIQLDTGIYRTADNWEIGTKTAAWGGVTTVIDFATQYPGMNLNQAIDHRLTESQPAVIDYNYHCMITGNPVDEEIRDLVGRGVSSLKVFTTYRPNYFVEDALILKIMTAAARYGAIVMVHCENDSVVAEATEGLIKGGKTSLAYHGRSRPIFAEEEAVNRVLYLAEEAGCKVYIVHCSSSKSVQQVRRAVQRGVKAHCETCPQYLFLDDTLYLSDNPEFYILQPPLRPKVQSEALWRLLALSVIDVVSTDHCDYTLAQKTEFGEFTKTPGGLPGLETMFPLMFTHSLDKARSPLTSLVRLMSTNPARIFGLDHRKGDLRAGLDADVVIYDPQPRSYLSPDDLHNIAGYTPYAGYRVRGVVRTVLVRGQKVIENREFVGIPGYGKFIPAHAV